MLARLIAVGALVLAGCYDLPHPVCGFACASQATVCPDGYTCNASDNRCHLDGFAAASCESVPDDPDNDFFAPQVVFFSPQSFNEPTSTVVSVQFDENVKHVDESSFFITDDVTGQVFPSSVTSSNPLSFSLALNTVTFPFGASYTAHLTPAITDVAGNSFGGFTFQFAIMSDAAPSIDFSGFIQPFPGESSVPVDTLVTVTMTEPVMTLAGKFHLLGSGVDVPTTIDSTGVAMQAMLEPVEQLLPFMSYTAVVDFDVTDLNGNIAGSTMTWNFTTGADTVPASVRETMPKANSVAPVGSWIIVTFDEPLFSLGGFTVTSGATTITGAITASAGGRTWTFMPDAPLPAGSVISVSLTGARDNSSNLTNFSYNFATAP
ncbi:hypothetical protein BH11MYX2_BH11MYX2_03620 [soil metagenome]